MVVYYTAVFLYLFNFVLVDMLPFHIHMFNHFAKTSLLFWTCKTHKREHSIIYIILSVMSQYPISFSIPTEKFKEIRSRLSTSTNKLHILSPLIPGNSATYIYETEDSYYRQYNESYFALTMKKGGWDCMRHYEIILAGCLPYFIDIEQCPENTMALWDKQMLLEANALYRNSFENKSIDSVTSEDLAAYDDLLERFLAHLESRFTAGNMAKYILETAGFPHAKRVLYLSGQTGEDYLRCITLGGFKELLGDGCHDFPRIPHIYKGEPIDYRALYGRGFTYSDIVDPKLRDGSRDASIEEDIRNKYYDVVIYGSYHRGVPYYDLVSSVYEPSRVILLCGEDAWYHNICFDHHVHVGIGHPVFVREL